MSDINTNGRDTRGLFVAGNQISKGNLGNGTMKALRRELLACATPEKVREVEAKLFELAKDGDIAAIRTWLDHVVGRPIQAIEVSTPDGSSLNLSAIVGVVMQALGDDEPARIRVASAFRHLGSSAPEPETAE